MPCKDCGMDRQVNKGGRCNDCYCAQVEERESTTHKPTIKGFCKLRFVSKYHHGETAGLIFTAEALKGQTIADLSRYFPVGECNKMDRLERSPFFTTWDEAFQYTFTKTGKEK